MKDHIVMCGDPVIGFKFIGPFTRDEAYAEFERLDKIVDKKGAVWVISPISTGGN